VNENHIKSSSNTIKKITMSSGIQRVDLKGQYNKIKEDINEAIQHVLDTTAFINGPQVKSFEKELADYLQVKHVIACANGTDALQIAFMALGLQAGDEIIVPSFTYIATVEAAALLGLKPVMVEVDADTYNISPDAIATAITPKTKAIVAVHLYGQCAYMEEIMAIALTNKLFVIEDTAQALGAKYIFSDGSGKSAGCIGTIGTTSFFPSKNLGCYGDGGAMMTNDNELASKIRMAANHGQKVKYHHEVIGVNSRLDTMQAAILSVKLKQLDTYCEARQAVAAKYDDAFSNIDGLEIPARNPQSSHVFHQYTLRLTKSDRDSLKKHLEDKGIPSMVYYPVPNHLQKGFKYLGYKEGDMPLTEQLCKEVISLPIHTEMEPEIQAEIIKGVLSFFK
jgi:UDP-2-acetamido-2-deoxy-ribo-hexuluronate aminotransferase